MDSHQSIVDYLLALPVFDSWGEMMTILLQTASKRPRAWELPAIACEAAGESPLKAIPACAALACAQISIILMDDMLDHDPGGEYRRIGNGRAANLASAFQAAGAEALSGSQASSLVKLEALSSLNRMMLTTAHGQELDVQNPADEISYWQVVEKKSAAFYGCALYLGALFGEGAKPAAKTIERLGQLYGEMIQIHDDLNDTLAVPATPDWVQGRKPLPILFALSVEHPNRERFLELYQDISIENALEEAQEILIRCGAVSYCVDQLWRRHHASQDILGKTSLPNKRGIAALLASMIAPVYRILETLRTPSETRLRTDILLNRE